MSFSFLNEFLAAILIGLVQGITEFLPISSTAHIDLLSRILLGGRDIGLSTSNIIQFGTTIALLLYFKTDLLGLWNRILALIKNRNDFNEWWNDTKIWWNLRSENLFVASDEKKHHGYSKFAHDNLLLSQLALGTIPIAVMGLFLQKYIDLNLRTPGYVAIFLLLGAGTLILSEYFNAKFKNPQDKEKSLNPLFLTRDQVIMIGLFQSLAVFPGMSRSGSTIAGSLFVGLNRPQAAKFAFLIGIPALLISSLKDLVEIFTKALKQAHFLPSEEFWTKTQVELSFSAILVAAIISFIVGYVCLKWLISYLSKTDTKYFSYYRIGLAITIFGYILITGFLK